MKPDERRESSGNATAWVYIYCKALNSWHLVFIHCHLNHDFKENGVFKIWEVNRVLASAGEEPVMFLLYRDL